MSNSQFEIRSNPKIPFFQLWIFMSQDHFELIIMWDFQCVISLVHFLICCIKPLLLWSIFLFQRVKPFVVVFFLEFLHYIIYTFDLHIFCIHMHTPHSFSFISFSRPQRSGIAVSFFFTDSPVSIVNALSHTQQTTKEWFRMAIERKKSKLFILKQQFHTFFADDLFDSGNAVRGLMNWLRCVCVQLAAAEF